MRNIKLVFIFVCIVVILCCSYSCSSSPKSKESPIHSKYQKTQCDYRIIDSKVYPEIKKESYTIEIPYEYDKNELVEIINSVKFHEGRKIEFTFRMKDSSVLAPDYAKCRVNEGKYYIDEFNDSNNLKKIQQLSQPEDHKGYNMIGNWVVYNDETYAIYEKGGKYYGVFLKGRNWNGTPTSLKKYKYKGHDAFEQTKDNTYQEFMYIMSDGLHIDSRLEPGATVWPKAK